MVKVNFSWDAENLHFLVNLWPHWSATEIGKVLGCSRCAVIGKAWRMKLPRKNLPHYSRVFGRKISLVDLNQYRRARAD